MKVKVISIMGYMGRWDLSDVWLSPFLWVHRSMDPTVLRNFFNTKNIRKLVNEIIFIGSGSYHELIKTIKIVI